MMSKSNPALVQLGKTGLQIPPMGIGAWSWGDTMFWGYGKGYGETDIHEAFGACLDAGVNFFDTAEVYGLGQSELFLGRMLKADGREAVIATKYFPYPFRLTGGSVARALRGSLGRLQRESADLYQIHQPFSLIPDSVLMRSLAAAAREGLIRAAGVSNYGPARTARAADRLEALGLPLASNQVSYSLLNRAPEKNGLLALCVKRGISLIAYSPMAMGILSGRYTADSPPPGFRRNRYPKEYLARLAPLLGLMREIGGGYGGRTLVQVALNWVIAKGAIPIPGVKNKRQAEDVLGTLGWRLRPDEVAALDAASGALGGR
jgi:aryl-alcohol dehydrogenase-like predicted oxidoreductase